MSGSAQGFPQRLTAFVDPRTGLVTDAWWRFLNSIYQRTGGAQSTTSLTDLIAYNQMDDVPQVPAPAFDPMGDVPPGVPPEVAAWLAIMMADVPREPENDPALIAMMVT